MPHFKTPDNALHFLSDEDIANGGLDLLPLGCVEITDQEAEAIRAAAQAAAEAAAPPAPQVSPEQKLAAFLAANPDVLNLVQGAAA